MDGAILEEGNCQVTRHLGKGAVQPRQQRRSGRRGKKGSESAWPFEGERSGLYRCSGCGEVAGDSGQSSEKGETIPEAVNAILQAAMGCL